MTEQGRRKPFRYIGHAIVDLEWRAKNIDCKAIEAEETNGGYIFALIVNKAMDERRDTSVRPSSTTSARSPSTVKQKHAPV
jgi:hypothetical protein